MYLAQILFPPTTSLTKLSILYSYLRIAPDRHTSHRIYIIMGLVICWFISTFFTFMFQCAPIYSYWIDTVKGARCLDSGALMLSAGAINSLLDVIVAVLPAPMLLKAKLPGRERGTLVIAFAFTGTVGIVGIARGVAIYNTMYGRSYDLSCEYPLI